MPQLPYDATKGSNIGTIGEKFINIAIVAKTDLDLELSAEFKGDPIQALRVQAKVVAMGAATVQGPACTKEFKDEINETCRKM